MIIQMNGKVHCQSSVHEGPVVGRKLINRVDRTGTRELNRKYQLMDFRHEWGEGEIWLNRVKVGAGA